MVVGALGVLRNSTFAFPPENVSTNLPRPRLTVRTNCTFGLFSTFAVFHKWLHFGNLAKADLTGGDLSRSNLQGATMRDGWIFDQRWAVIYSDQFSL